MRNREAQGIPLGLYTFAQRGIGQGGMCTIGMVHTNQDAPDTEFITRTERCLGALISSANEIQPISANDMSDESVTQCIHQ